MKAPVQLQLLNPDPPVCRTRLEAMDSPRHAYYEIAVYYITGIGYHIWKYSGAEGAKPNVEIWFRPNLRLAIDKKTLLINGKLNRKAKGTRIYTEVLIGGSYEQN